MTSQRNGTDGLRPASGDPPEFNPDRLDGWKEIAGYLRRAPRTAQRWEAQFGLPVHRIGGEVVYALRSEIDRWSVSEASRSAAASANGDGNGQSDGKPADGRAPGTRWLGRTWRQRILLISGMATAALAIALVTHVLATSPPIHGWRVSGNELRAFDADGRELWVYPLPTREGPDQGGPEIPTTDDQRRALIEDLDGDGSSELVFVSRPPDSKEAKLFVLDAKGHLRFAHQRTAGADFGGVPQLGPFQAAWVEVTANADGSKALWLQSRHFPFFASVIEKLDPQGHRLADYWNGGSLSQLAVGTFGGRRLVFIGGDANEGHGAALAVFEEDQVGGGNVGGDVAHTCTSCGPVKAMAIFIFPRHDVGDAAPSESKVSLISLKDEAEIQVDVEYYNAEVPGLPGLQHAVANFVFDPSFRLIHAEHGAGYRILHDYFFKKGRLDHPYGDRDRAQLSPVRQWVGGMDFEPLYLTPEAQVDGAAQPAAVPGR